MSMPIKMSNEISVWMEDFDFCPFPSFFLEHGQYPKNEAVPYYHEIENFGLTILELEVERHLGT